MITFGEFSVEYVLNSVKAARQRYAELRAQGVRLPPRDQVIELECNGRWFVIRVGSQRYTLFSQNRQCVRCGIVGTKFLLQASELSWRWYDGDRRVTYPVPFHRAHFNLFAERNGGLVLMTKDHIVPVSKGGSNFMSNYQTMCTRCNHKKGAKDEGSARQILKTDVKTSPARSARPLHRSPWMGVGKGHPGQIEH